jgi:SAM-dependent methyltransferase
MHELLAALPVGARVLDLGARSGSFETPRRDIHVVRLDLEVHPRHGSGSYVAGDAARMPFATHSFDLVISNHSLEHFVELEATVREIGRVARPGGALFVAVPDAGTMADRIYRWLGRGGGHVNAFRSPEDVIGLVERLTGLKHRGTRVLISSFSFLNARNIEGRRQKKLAVFGFGNERYVAAWVWLLRALDHRLGTRLSHYGWSFYFGNAAPAKNETWVNVCVRCGSGHPAMSLPRTPAYRCPACGGWNLFSGPRRPDPQCPAA